MKIILICSLVFMFHTGTRSFDLKDIGKSAGDVAKGIVDKLPDVIPSPEDIFQGGKNLIAGYPVQSIFSAINSFCE